MFGTNTKRVLHLDWIQDSILERNRRLRTSRDIQTSLRDSQGRINPSWVKAQIQKLIAAGQSWFVVSIAGMHTLRASCELSP
jgi:chloride channel 3/4/5